MVDQPPCMSMSVCAVMNCRQTGVMSLQVTTTNGSIFPHGEPGFTNEMEDHISPALKQAGTSWKLYCLFLKTGCQYL